MSWWVDPNDLILYEELKPIITNIIKTPCAHTGGRLICRRGNANFASCKSRRASERAAVAPPPWTSSVRVRWMEDTEEAAVAKLRSASQRCPKASHVGSSKVCNFFDWSQIFWFVPSRTQKIFESRVTFPDLFSTMCSRRSDSSH